MSDPEAPADVSGPLTRSGHPGRASRLSSAGLVPQQGNHGQSAGDNLLACPGCPDLVMGPDISAGASGSLICSRYIACNI